MAKKLLTPDLANAEALRRDAKIAAEKMSGREVAYITSLYLMFLKNRVAAQGRIRTLPHDPNFALSYIMNIFEQNEEESRQILTAYTDAHPIAKEMKKIKGIGSIISAGYVSHVNMDRVVYFGQVLSYGGYCPNKVWKKGEKRPYNMDFRSVLIHAGRSFLFSSGYPDSYFGAHYRINRQVITDRNETGYYKPMAKAKLEKFNYRKETAAYKAYTEGKLPPAHIVALARFKCVSLFVGIVHDYWSRQLGRSVIPYPFAYLGHEILNYKTLEEVFAFEEEQREQIKLKGNRKDVERMTNYEAWKKEHPELIQEIADLSTVREISEADALMGVDEDSVSKEASPVHETNVNVDDDIDEENE